MTIPSMATLKKYGLTLDEWVEILTHQGGVCPICQKEPTTGRWVTDHEHVKGWKDLPSNERKKYVRGVTCWFCNGKILIRGVTPEKLRRAAQYLEEWEKKKNGR